MAFINNLLRKRHQSPLLVMSNQYQKGAGKNNDTKKKKLIPKIIVSSSSSSSPSLQSMLGDYEVVPATSVYDASYAYYDSIDDYFHNLQFIQARRRMKKDRNFHFCKNRISNIRLSRSRALLMRIILFLTIGCFFAVIELFQLQRLVSWKYLPVIIPKKVVIPNDKNDENFLLEQKPPLVAKRTVLFKNYNFPKYVILRHDISLHASFFLFYNNYNHRKNRRKFLRNNSISTIKDAHTIAPPLFPMYRQVDDIPDLGGLKMISLRMMISNGNDELVQRQVRANDDFWYGLQRNTTLNLWDENDGHSHEKYYAWEDNNFERDLCQRPAWTYELHPNCNHMHEVITYDRVLNDPDDNILKDYDYSYLGHGHYRDSFLYKSPYSLEEIVLKSLRYERHSDRNNFMLIYSEAVTMDVLSSSSRIANMYSYCGDSQIVEKGYDIESQVLGHFSGQKELGFIPQLELDKLQVNDVHPMNNLTNEEKLEMAIAMAEGIAEQHGYYKGVMMNDDIEVRQWLQRDDGSIFLNDLANTFFLAWDNTSQSYCKEWSQYGGNFKAPEEYTGAYVDESSDIWPVGNLIYTLLTGLHPYHHIDPMKQPEIWNATQTYVPYIDPRYKMNRSYIERRLVTIMERCYRHNPKDRISIFDVVEYLQETKRLYSMNIKNNQQNDENKTPDEKLERLKSLFQAARTAKQLNK